MAIYKYRRQRWVLMEECGIIEADDASEAMAQARNNEGIGTYESWMDAKRIQKVKVKEITEDEKWDMQNRQGGWDGIT